MDAESRELCSTRKWVLVTIPIAQRLEQRIIILEELRAYRVCQLSLRFLGLSGNLKLSDTDSYQSRVLEPQRRISEP